NSCKQFRRLPAAFTRTPSLISRMPIYECDQWREQYFTAVECPPYVHIPTDDSMAYALNPRHRWIYNKLIVARAQGIECGSQEVAPRHYPVFSKPVTNLKGMGVGKIGR